MRKVVLFNKPYDVLSQFTDSRHQGEKRQTLADYLTEADVYPAGRLDRDSEGLLVLTDDGALKHKLANPEHKVSKTYWAQVEGIPEEHELTPFRDGLELRDGMTRPATAQIMATPEVWDRNPRIRERKNIPTSWLKITLKEGRNRQVRRMCAAVGFPVLRLIRYRVASWTIDGLEPGESRLLELA